MIFRRRDLGTGIDAARRGGKHEVLSKQAAVKPTANLKLSVDREEVRNRRVGEVWCALVMA
jgi:hypothetical protein